MKDQHIEAPSDRLMALAACGAGAAAGAKTAPFQLTDEAIDAPVIGLNAALEEANKFAASVFCRRLKTGGRCLRI